MSLSYDCFITGWGWIAIMGSFVGLCRTTLPMPDEKSAIEAVTHGVSATRSEEAFADVKHALINYFKGEPVELLFPLDLDLEGCTDFQRDVWEATSRIPYGKLRSYGWIAAEIGRPLAPRAVGQALGANRIPIVIPCHRVVRSDGSLGGFSGGLHWKEKLIQLENAVFIQ
jgi:methylated-DNA-[protein]-cysteine S-methyltransferase